MWKLWRVEALALSVSSLMCLVESLITVANGECTRTCFCRFLTLIRAVQMRKKSIVKRKTFLKFKKPTKLSIFDGIGQNMDLLTSSQFDSLNDHAQLLLKAYKLSREEPPSPALPFLEQELNNLHLRELQNTAYIWGNDNRRLSGTIFGSSSPEVFQLPLKKDDNIVSVAVGERHCAFVTLQGKLYVCGTLFSNVYTDRELLEPKLVASDGLDVVGVAAVGHDTVTFIDNPAHSNLDIALLTPDFKLVVIPKDDDLAVVKLSEKGVILRKCLKWKAVISFVRNLRIQLKHLREDFPKYESQNWNPYEESFKRIAENLTLMMRAMLTLLVYLQTRTLQLPPDNFVESELVRLIETSVRILDVFLRSARMFELLALEKKDDKKKPTIINFFEQMVPKFSDFRSLMENLQAMQEDERLHRALIDIKEKETDYLNFYTNVLKSTQKIGALKSEMKSGLLNSVLVDNAALVRILVNSRDTSSVELKQISEGRSLDFSKGSLILTNSSLILIDAHQKNIARYPLHFVWITKKDILPSSKNLEKNPNAPSTLSRLSSQSSLVLTFPEMELEVTCGVDTLCFHKDLVEAINRIFNRDRMYPQDIDEWRARSLRPWTFITGPDEGATYTGEWFDGKPHGIGSLQGARRDGYLVDYEGEFQDGKFHGLGSCTKSLTNYVSEKWAGLWRNDKLDGFGMYHAFEHPDSTSKRKRVYPKFFGVFKDAKKEGDFFVLEEGAVCFAQFINDRKNGKSLTVDRETAGGAIVICSYEADEHKITQCQKISHNYVYFGCVDENRQPNGQGMLRLYIENEPKIIEMQGVISVAKSIFPVKLESATDDYGASINVTFRPTATVLSKLLRVDCANFSQRWDALFEQCCDALVALTKDDWNGMRKLQQERNVDLDISAFTSLANKEVFSFEEWERVKTAVSVALRINYFPMSVFFLLRDKLFNSFAAISLIDWACIIQTVVSNFTSTVKSLYSFLRILLPTLPDDSKVEIQLTGAKRAYTGYDLALDVLPSSFLTILSCVLDAAIQKRWKHSPKPADGHLTESLVQSQDFDKCKNFFRDRLTVASISTSSEAVEFLELLEEGVGGVTRMLQGIEMDNEEHRIATLAILFSDRSRDHFAFNLLFTWILTQHNITPENRQLLELVMEAELLMGNEMMVGKFSEV